MNSPESGLLYRGQRYFATCDKNAFPRSKCSDETLADVEPLFRIAGITRLADITGLDRIGIPVTLAIRPNARTLSISSGKGVTMGDAWVSGAMEALELFHAEHSPVTRFNCSYRELVADGLAIDQASLPFRRHSLVRDDWSETWTMGWDIVHQRQVAVPINLAVMYTSMRNGDRFSLSQFATDSNGLASGNNLVEAILSALYEVIERDAVAIHKMRSKVAGGLVGRIDPKSIPYSRVQSLVERINRAGIGVYLYDCMSDANVPVYRCIVTERSSVSTETVEGFGAHLNQEIALLRSITEACQGRSVVISGARDDIFFFHLERAQLSSRVKMADLLEKYDAGQLKPSSYHVVSLDQDLNQVVSLLKRISVKQIIVVNLSMFDCAQSFVKVVVPGLEGYPNSSSIPGRRALDILPNATSALPQYDTIPSSHYPAGGSR